MFIMVSPIITAAFLFMCAHGSMCGIASAELSGRTASVLAHSDATCHCECHTAAKCSILSHTTLAVSAYGQLFAAAPLFPSGIVKLRSAKCLHPGEPPAPPLVPVVVNLRI